MMDLQPTVAAGDSKEVRVSNQQASAVSLEETRRAAREHWRRSYYDKRVDQLGPQEDSSRAEEEKTQPEQGPGLDFDAER
jgi:hypothetical protein